MCCNAQKKEKRDAFQLILEHDGANDSRVARKLRVTHEANLHNKKLNVVDSSVEKKSFRDNSDNIAAYAEIKLRLPVSLRGGSHFHISHPCSLAHDRAIVLTSLPPDFLSFYSTKSSSQ